MERKNIIKTAQDLWSKRVIIKSDSFDFYRSYAENYDSYYKNNSSAIGVKRISKDVNLIMVGILDYGDRWFFHMETDKTTEFVYYLLCLPWKKTH